MSQDTSISDTPDETAQAPTTQDLMEAALAAKGDGGGRGWEDGILSEYISPEQLALELDISTRTLDRWASLREGPPRTRLGKRILYRRESFSAWLLAREAA